MSGGKRRKSREARGIPPAAFVEALSETAVPSPAAARPPRRRTRKRRISLGVHLYLAREIIKSFLLIFVACQVVVSCIFGIQAVRDYGIDMGLLLHLLVPAMALNVHAALPVSLLFGTALVFGRLIADREIAALKSFGFSSLELAGLPAALGGIIGAGALVLYFWVVPDLRSNKENIGAVILARLNDLGEGWNRTFDISDSYTFWVQHFEGNRLEGIFIAGDQISSVGLKGVDRQGAGPKVESKTYPFFLYANEGEVLTEPGSGGRALSIELRGVTGYYDDEFLDKDVLTDFKQQGGLGKMQIAIETPEGKKKIRDLTIKALNRRIRELRKRWKDAEARGDPSQSYAKVVDDYRSAVDEVHRRIGFAIMVLTFPFAGACLALFLNSMNRLLPVFVSIMVVPSVFFLLEMKGNSLALDGQMPAISQQLGNVGLLVLIGGLLFVLRRRTIW
jgi:lipopolysaccharide export LptBFGC system permease protein LptF